MQWTDRVRHVKVILVIVAVLIAVISLIVSHRLIRDLEKEEQNKMEIWAEAMRTLNEADENTDLNLVLKVMVMIVCWQNTEKMLKEYTHTG